jgi:hypothetical protein
MFILGLGWNVKAYFIWFIISLFISAFLFYIPRHKLKIKTAFFSLLAFLLGALPILSVYCKNNFYNRFGGKGFVSQGGINNLEILKNLFMRLGHLNLILEGSLYWGDSSSLDYDYRLFAVFFFWFCVFGLSYLAFIKKRTILSRRRIAFILAITFTMFLLSIITFTWLRKGHFIILLPYLQLLMAVVIFEIWNISGHRANRIAAYILASSLVSVNIIRCGQMYQMLKQEGLDKASCNVTMLAQWLADNKIHNPICFTPCLLEFSSNLKIQPYYLPWYLVDCYPEIKGRLEDKIRNASANDCFIFGLSADGDAQNTFNALANKFNKEVIIKKEFFWPNGKPRFIICALK